MRSDEYIAIVSKPGDPPLPSLDTRCQARVPHHNQVIHNGKKLTKEHTQNFDCEKLAHKICAKNAKNCAKLAHKKKIAQKRQKHLRKSVKKTKN